MARKFLPSLAAAAFAAILFRLFRRRGDQSRSTEESAKTGRVCGNDGTAGGASSTHTSTEGQEVPASGYDYEVFLSFRGPDTREGFTDFLYTRLTEVGIRTFRDNEELRSGEEFEPKLCQAIEQSKISIPIFSKDYASSVWCLKELVQMVAYQKAGRQKIMPIFYDAKPSEDYKMAFSSPEIKKQYDEKTIQEWKDALNAVAGINGWDLQSMSNGLQGEFTKRVTHDVLRELKKPYLAISKSLVSVDNHIDAIMEMIGTSETRIIGIHGMGGIGKTTIAKLIYNKLSDNFKHRCFLPDVQEKSKNKGIHGLQNDLISDILKTECINIKYIDEGTQQIEDKLSNKKVLLLLDDVEEENHIDALVGKPNWLGKGSKIIITTRNKEVLKRTKVDNLYEVNGMDPNQSLQLFSKYAFRRDSPLDGYIDQSERAIGIAQGLPLALVVIGSLLSPYTEKEKWDKTLDELAKIPNKNVQKKLKISFDALGVRQQQIFLDIACFFIGYDKDIVVYFWDKSKFPEDNIENLQNMSLIKITEDNKVWMHDQLRDLGREIVREESKMNIEKQSRVWDLKEAFDLLKRPKGRKEVEALRLNFDHKVQLRFTYEGFKSLSNLRFLQVDGWMEYFDAKERLFWHESPLNVLPTNVFPENLDLLPLLRWLAWHDIPPTFKIMNFSMENVVILDLSKSIITYDWEGWSHMKVMKNLKVLDLHSCFSLERTPDFSTDSNLERLILQGCCELVEIDNSICQLESLVFLDVSHCRNIWRLPDTIGNLKSLMELDILGTGIKELPNSIGNLILLKKLVISRMGFKELPDSIGSLKSLIKLDISDTMIKGLPDSIENFKSLVELDISSTEIKELPDSIGKLENLKVVKMNHCPTRKIPDALWTMKLEVIEALNCYIDVKIGNHICRNRSLRILQLFNSRIYVVPRLPESLTILGLSDLYMNTFPDLSNLTNLKELELWFMPRDSNGKSEGESDGPVEKDLPRWIGNLSKLESLYLRSPYMTALPTDIRSLLPQLKSLKLRCPNLGCLPSLPSSLSELDLESKCVAALPTDMSSLLPRLETLSLKCPNLHCLLSLPSTSSELDLKSKCETTLPTDMSSLFPRLQSLQLRCPNLSRLPSLPPSLESLYLSACKSCYSMEDISNLKTLSDLEIFECAISEIQGLDRLENLIDPWFRNLQQVKLLPDLRNLNKLWRLRVSDCDNLVEIQGELPSSLQELVILGCGSLQKLPALSSLKGLRKVEIKRCGKLNVEEISSLCLEKAIKFVGEDDDSKI